MNESIKKSLDTAEEKVESAKDAVSEVSENLADQTKQIADASVEMAKKYPLHTAVGAAAVGLAVGLFLNRK